MEHEGCYGCGCLARRLADAQATVEALQRERDEAYRQGFADALEKVAREFQDKGFCSTDDIGVVEVQAFLDTRHVHYEECHGVNPLQSELDALKALVRAAVERWRAQTNVKEGISFRMAMKELEATLDATTLEEAT